MDGYEVSPEVSAKKASRGKKSKAVRELLRDLDAYPKQVHTFTVERSVPVVTHDAGAFQLKARGEHWIMYPCSADEVNLTPVDYQRALQAWLAALQQGQARSARW